MNLNPKQFSTKEQADKLAADYGTFGGGAIVDIPKYGLDVPTPELDATHKMYMLYFGNGIVSNVGLLTHNIEVLGAEGARNSLKAEMVAAGITLPWWVK